MTRRPRSEILLDQREIERMLDVQFRDLPHFSYELVLWLLKRADVGVPFNSIYRERRNAAGQLIGPEMKVDAELVALARDILAAIEKAAARVPQGGSQ